jgi:predicted ATP-binding protein involved in virulence
MRIDTIKIENFRLFKEQEFNFQPQFNLIIGQNGSGKTSLLEALAVALGGWAHAYIKSDTNLRPIQDKEIREIQLQNRFDKADYSTITAEGETTVIDRNADKRRVFASWERYMTYSFENTTTSGKIKYGCYPVEYNLNFSTLRGDILNYIEKEELFELPIIAFYKCDRLWLSQDVNREIAMQTKYSRFDPYIDCFHIGLNNEQLVTWIIKNELASIQQGKITPVLESIRKAAQCALENCTSIRFDIKESRILVDFDNKPSIPFEHLSDGQRTLLSLFCDLARRAEILNPHLEGNASAKTEGVVLIDELDLHLHPKWQRNIIENLRKAFPNIQFICTTH